MKHQRPIIDLPGQTFLFDLGESVRRSPTRDELDTVLPWAAKTVMHQLHRGRPPSGMDWEDLLNEIIGHAIPRLKNFQHGGKKTLQEYSYMSCKFALRDIQAKYLKSQRDSVRVEYLPLFEAIA